MRWGIVWAVTLPQSTCDVEIDQIRLLTFAGTKTYSSSTHIVRYIARKSFRN